MSASPTWSLEDLTLRLERVTVSALADAMDQCLITDHVLQSGIRPVYPDAVVFGRAFTVLSVPVKERGSRDIDLMIDSTDQLRPGDVAVYAAFGHVEAASWGELLSTAAQARGARGAIVDGLVRDARRIIAARFPVFARGRTPADSLGRSAIVGYGDPVLCGGVWIRTGDLMYGDCDGVVAIPAAVAPEIVDAAYRKCTMEDAVRDELRNGRCLREAYDRYHVL